MKYKMLSAVIATALLSACGSDDPSSDIKSFDPIVAGMQVSYDCTDGSQGTVSTLSGADGIVKVTDSVPAILPETCEFTSVGLSNAVDMSNGKSMAGVSYVIPVGMAVAGKIVTASPLSTLLAKTLNGEEYSEEAATQLLTDLGLGDLINKGASVAEIFLDTDTAANALPASEKSKLLATTAVVSDTIVANPDATAEQLTTGSEKVSAAVFADYPEYPDNGNGTDIYLDVKEASKAVVEDPNAIVEVPDEIIAVPVEPEDAPTGGTGGNTGGGTGG
ncbi:hypothetical protein GCM10007916_17620 [Psychromonas marina]|uniref:Serine/threonine protein kinase n=1 Tax=Psychromonas marina TaxID=88364 RepID=A0ABQ6E0G2_9GAMM|nr:hypothetical protein [Psychromonas marina]GLS90695.1 hypothetical protein GCM10007916_17620 [Psychromonas marina]